MSTAKINKNFRIVYQEKRPADQPRARHLVGAGRLHLYIGEDNAKKCFEKALECMDDKKEIRLRKHGLVIFYNK